MRKKKKFSAKAIYDSNPRSKLKMFQTLADICYFKSHESIIKQKLKIPVLQAAEAVDIPYSTLKFWLRTGIVEGELGTRKKRRGFVDFACLTDIMMLKHLTEVGFSLGEAKVLILTHKDLLKTLLYSLADSVNRVSCIVSWPKKEGKSIDEFHEKWAGLDASKHYSSKWMQVFEEDTSNDRYYIKKVAIGHPENARLMLETISNIYDIFREDLNKRKGIKIWFEIEK